jgi:hypothetical protein
MLASVTLATQAALLMPSLQEAKHKRANQRDDEHNLHRA